MYCLQLAPNYIDDTLRAYPSMRFAQSYDYGFAPNPLLPRFFMAVAMDTPDVDGPHGSIHPRYKRQVASRLALAGLAVAYYDESEGLWQGPLPTSFRLEENNLVITLAEGQVPLEVRDTETATHYEVCCANDPALTCDGEGDDVNTRWELTQFVSESGGDVTVTAECDLSTEFVVGVRYMYSLSFYIVL